MTDDEAAEELRKAFPGAHAHRVAKRDYGFRTSLAVQFGERHYAAAIASMDTDDIKVGIATLRRMAGKGAVNG